MKSKLFRQIYASFIVCLPMLHFGWDCGWVEAHFNEVQSPKNASHNDLSFHEKASLSLMQFIAIIGALVSSLFYLFVVETVGRRKSFLILSVPLIAACWLTFLAQNEFWIYGARLLIGLSVGAASISAPIFIAEISSDSIRGILNAILFFSYSIGKVTALLIATLAPDDRKQALYSFSVPTIFAVGLCFLPETPNYLKKTKQFEAAKRSIEFYNGSEVIPEAENLFKQPNPIETAPNSWRQQFCKSLSGVFGVFVVFVGSSATRRAWLIAAIMSTMSNLCGIIVLFISKTEILDEISFKTAATSIQSSLWISIVALLGQGLAICLVDLIGRKFLLISSLIGTSAGFFTIYAHHVYQGQTINAFAYNTYLANIFFACVGILPISHVYKMDILPSEIRNVIVAVLQVLFWVLSLSAVGAGKNSFLVGIIGWYGCFLAFGSLCLVYALFVIVYVPETKGKSYHEIALLFEK